MPKKKKSTEGEEAKKTEVPVTTKKAPISKPEKKQTALAPAAPWIFGELLTMSLKGSEAILKISSFHLTGIEPCLYCLKRGFQP